MDCFVNGSGQIIIDEWISKGWYGNVLGWILAVNWLLLIQIIPSLTFKILMKGETSPNGVLGEMIYSQPSASAIKKISRLI